MNCPECKNEIKSISGYGKAEVTTLALVEFQVLPKDKAEIVKSLADVINLSSTGQRTLPDFRYAGTEDLIDSNIGHANLEWDDEKTEFFCDECQFNLPRKLVEEWLKS